MTRSALPPSEKADLKLGYVRLTDSAPLIVALEHGLFDKYGLAVTLSQEVTWANVRDKLTVGALDAAQMLAPLPAMTTLGASGLRTPLVYGLTLSRNGNAITLSKPLWREVRMRAGPAANATQTARALRAAIRARGGADLPTFGVVHSFSTHMILLRRWLGAGGIDVDRDVRTIVVPPAQMVDSLAAGVIDGYCVGEPWNSIAVQSGHGAIAAIGRDVWRDAPEKVLCTTERWHDAHPAAHLRLRLALMEACTWLNASSNRAAAAELIARPAYLDLPVEALLPSLTGALGGEPGSRVAAVADFLVFGATLAGMPWPSRAAVMIRQCGSLLGRTLGADQVTALAQRTARHDLFVAAADHLGIATDGPEPAWNDAVDGSPGPDHASFRRKLGPVAPS